MNTLVKRTVAAVAIKKGIDKVRELRRPPEPSLAERLRKAALIAGAGGGLFYLYRSGKLAALLAQVRGVGGPSGRPEASTGAWSPGSGESESGRRADLSS